MEKETEKLNDDIEYRMRIEAGLEPQRLLRTDRVNRVSQNYRFDLLQRKVIRLTEYSFLNSSNTSFFF